MATKKKVKGWFSLEAVYAKKGDALILHYGSASRPRWMLIDGGHDDVYEPFLRPRLEELRLSRPERLDGDGLLPLELLMVSHADADHLQGILDLTANKVSEANGDHGVPRAPVSVKEIWFNGFADILGSAASVEEASVLDGLAQTASVGSGGIPLPPAAAADRDVAAVIASTRQGRQLLKDAVRLDIDVNAAYEGGLVMRQEDRPALTKFTGGLSFTLLVPDKKRVDRLRRKWKSDLKSILKKEKAAAEAASFSDSSPFNLSSITVLAKRLGRTMLLTGDARGDHVLAGLEAEGLLDASGKIAVDVFKLPHHGSDRNVKTETFRDITATHYVISANGEHENPDVATLDMLVEGRARTRSDPFTLHLTFPDKAFELISEESASKKKKIRKQKDALEALELWLASDRRPANMSVEYRDRHRTSLAIDLGEESVFG